MVIDLSSKTALITGASRGIGLACAEALAKAGAKVVLLARNPKDLERAAQTIGPQARRIVCDVTDPEALSQAFEQVTHLDILVNSAGLNIPEPFLEVSPAHFDRIFDLNVRSVFFTTQHAVRRMGPGGVVIQISSQMGHVGAVNRSVYCASKHALEGLTKALAVELAPRGIRVVSVAPTFIETDLTRPMLADPQFYQSVLGQIPLGQLGQPQDVAAAVVFLASDAAGLISGTSLLVDGGWTAK